MVTRAMCSHISLLLKSGIPRLNIFLKCLNVESDSQNDGSGVPVGPYLDHSSTNSSCR